VACLRSLEQLDHRDDRVIVVDNGSDDGSSDRIREACPGVEILQTGTNLGFSGGNNAGIRRSLELGAGYIWLLNNDTVVSRGSLSAMVEEMHRGEQVGIVGSVIRKFSEPEVVEAWGGGSVNAHLAMSRRHTGPGQGRLGYLAGASMLVRREVFEEIGLLDEAFFFYLEDVDFCSRAKARGWKLAIATGAVVLHKGGATVNGGQTMRSERADRYHARSTGTFLGKWAGAWVLPSAALRLCGMVVRRMIRGQARRLPGLGAEFLRGLSIGLRVRARLDPSSPSPLIDGKARAR
jgi:GT2 family glycosyltransferase